MFVKNSNNQLNLDDPLYSMPKYLKRNLENSWATVFAEQIFPEINEKRFSVLYSNNYASRPNTPVNIIIGLLCIKSMFMQSDEELISSLHFDFRYQYALHTTSFEKQPVSINTLTNFRNRLIQYEKESGIDLIKEEIETISKGIADTLKIDGKTMRMDSLMVSSSCKNLSRIELIYSVNAKFIKFLEKENLDLIPESCKDYLEKGHKNDTIYRTRDSESETKLQFLFNHTQDLYNVAINSDEKITSSKEFKLVSRLIEEQTTKNESDELILKAGKDIASDSLQNPTDEDATYRKKYSGNVGYTANLVESVNEENSVILTYDLKQNIYSDIKFSEDVVDAMSLNKDQNEKIKLLVDGAYYSHEISEKAAKENIELIPGELVGKNPTKEKFSYSEFEIDSESNIINRCPGQKEPITSYYNVKKKSYTAKFSKDDCEKCPLYEQCPAKRQKKFDTVTVSKKRYEMDSLRQKMDTKEYQKITNKRAGVEGLPSVLRRRYRVDSMPVRGLLRTKLFLGFNIAAINIKRLIKYTKKVLKNAFLLPKTVKLLINTFLKVVISIIKNILGLNIELIKEFM